MKLHNNIPTMAASGNNSINRYAPGGKAPKGYVEIDRQKLKPGQHYGIVHGTGNCMDSPESPMRIKDDCYLPIRYLTPDIKTLRAEIGSMVVVETSMGIFTKCLTAINARQRTVSLTMYRPARVTMVFLMDEIKRIYKVEDVFSRGYIDANFQPVA